MTEYPSDLTVIVPYYRNQLMLAEQLAEWDGYPEQTKIIVVDDCSPEPAHPVIEQEASKELLSRIQLLRITSDIPWNRGGARNLGSHVADTKWLVHIDIDHVLPAGCVRAVLETPVSPKHWYRFPRFRRGAADETRRKDKIADDVEFGAIEPHIDSYLLTKSLYWRSGGYDEDYSGCLGGGSPFLKRLEQKSQKPSMLPPNVFLCVYTRHVIADSSDMSLSRDTDEYSRRRKVKETTMNTTPQNPMRFEWQRIL